MAKAAVLHSAELGSSKYDESLRFIENVTENKIESVANSGSAIP